MQNSYPAIFDSDKKQKFGISDTGEFIDNTYREQNPSKLLGRLIGRNSVHPNSKQSFTTADIVCECYLYKKGSWMKNWKKRYFILRRDIRSLCYYDSRENLTLLGSIPLDWDLEITVVSKLEADGYDNVILIKYDVDDDRLNNVYVRFDSEELLISWMKDLLNESKKMSSAVENTSDWWSELYDQVKSIEIKSNIRRDGLDASSMTGSGTQTNSFSRATSTASVKLRSNSMVGVEPVLPLDDMRAQSLLHDVHHDQDSDEDSPNEDSVRDHSIVKQPRSNVISTNNRKISEELVSGSSTTSSNQIVDTSGNFSKQRERVLTGGLQAKKDSNFSGMGTAAAASSGGIRKDSGFIKKAKPMKIEKPPGPPPFVAPSAKRFETIDHALSGLQISIRLCNVCAYQDRLFVVLFGILPTSSAESKWTQISCTELHTVNDRPIYGESYVSDYRIHFSAIANLIPDHCKDVRVVVYRQENDMDGKDLTKATNLKMQYEIAKCIIPKKVFDVNSVLKCTMPAKVEMPMDIAVPLFKDAEITLGIVILKSYSLYAERNILKEKFETSPYGEILYSFATNTGKSFSLEQLYASKYSISVAQSLVNLLQLERNQYSFDDLEKMRKDLSRYSSVGLVTNTNETTTIKANESVVDVATGDYIVEQMKNTINSIENMLLDFLSNTAIVLENCDNMEKREGLVNNVIDSSVGGAVLRRSVWKKVTAWQYVSTNLNVHLLLSKVYTPDDIVQSKETCKEDCKKNIYPTYCIPSITVGCPAAHELKFNDGGLKKIFIDITDDTQKLKWLHAIQSPKLEDLRKMFLEYPKEAQILFTSKYTMQTSEDLFYCMKRKIELANRIDVCASQALGSAITAVRTILILATMYRNRFYDILARSLKIGFLVLFQSMLSTQGAELGMIEDLYIAALWLSLVSIRLVVKHERTNLATQQQQTQKNKANVKVDEDNSTSSCFVGKGDGVYARRDKNGRLIIDLEITIDEGIIVLEALKDMGEFKTNFRDEYFGTSSPLQFSESPIIPKPVSNNNIEDDYTVYATAPLFGIVFTQGVNEMQTLANLASSRDVFRQVEINNSSLTRIETYYNYYKLALVYQMKLKTPELILSLESSLDTTAFDQLSLNPNLSIQNNKNSRFSLSGGSSSSHTSTTAISSSMKRKNSRQSISLLRNPSTNLPSLKETITSGIDIKDTIDTIQQKVINSIDRLFEQMKESIAISATNPYEKHVGVLLQTSALCREIGGITCILCKSGKDRTSMGVTLENTRSLVEDIGALYGQNICQLMRMQGVRRMNVYANTGQSLFAFNQIQRIALPSCYRPPAGSHGGNVQS